MKITFCFFFMAMGLFTGQVKAQQFNAALARQLAAIYQADQRYRVAAIEAAKKYGSGSAQDNMLMAKQDSADRDNLAKVEKIIAVYGYPGKSMVGAQQKVVFTVVQHNDLEAQEKYLPLFTKAASRGELDRSLLPVMIDRIRTNKGQPQLYGTQLSEIKGTNRVQIYPIENEAGVDIRRKAAGLPPLAAYYKHWGVTYRVPGRAGNTNPPDLYVSKQKRETSPVEAVGGDEAIVAKLQYPQQAQAENISGKVVVEFIVDKNGDTKNISVVKSLGYGCDEEAVRVIRETKYKNNSGEDNELRMSFSFPPKL